MPVGATAAQQASKRGSVVQDAQRWRHEPQPADRGEATGDASAGGLDDAWQFGVAASTAMAERLQELYRQLPAGGVGAGELDAELRRLRLDIERGADLMLDLFDRVLALVRRLDRSDAPDDRAADEELVIIVAPGESQIAELWAHNVSDAEHPPPELRCGPLTDWEGRAMPPSCVRVRCGTRPIQARNTRGVELVVDAPPDTAPGSYRGLVFVRHDADAAIRVRVDVTLA